MPNASTHTLMIWCVVKWPFTRDQGRRSGSGHVCPVCHVQRTLRTCGCSKRKACATIDKINKIKQNISYFSRMLVVESKSVASSA